MPAKKSSTTKVSKNPKLRRVNLLSSSINHPAKKKTSWPGFSPTISLVLIVIVALIVGGGLYYLSTETKSANTNTSISLISNRNGSSNINSSINSNAGTVTTPDGNVSLACTADIDCGFIDNTRTYSVCCATPFCLPDYSAEQYVVVNQQSHNNIVQAAVGQLDCATPCPSHAMLECAAVQQTVRAACLNGICQKVARSDQGSNMNTNGNINLNANSNANISVNTNLNNSSTSTSQKTYSNAETGVSFQYPPDWFITGEGAINNVVFWTMESWDSSVVLGRGGMDDGMVKADFSVSPNDGQTLETVITCSTDEPQYSAIVAFETVTVNGRQHKKCIIDSQVEGAHRSVTLGTVANGRKYIISGIVPVGSSQEASLLQLDNIYSTITIQAIL